MKKMFLGVAGAFALMTSAAVAAPVVPVAAHDATLDFNAYFHRPFFHHHHRHFFRHRFFHHRHFHHRGFFHHRHFF